MSTATFGDVPACGSGLGSSSALAVGLLNALYTMSGLRALPETLARDACEIEIDVLRKPIGAQDQCIAAYGGQQVLRFRPGGEVQVEPVGWTRRHMSEFERYLMLFFVRPRPPNGSLESQIRNMDTIRTGLTQLRCLVPIGAAYLRAGNFEAFGRLLHDGWQIKKQLATTVSNRWVDDMYDAARRAGALGGKICGAGGGGFLLLCCPPSRRAWVRAALPTVKELSFGLASEGTKVVFEDPVDASPHGTAYDRSVGRGLTGSAEGASDAATPRGRRRRKCAGR